MLFALAAIWGGSFLFIRIAVPYLGPTPLMAGRVLLGGLVLWTVYRLMRPAPLSLRENAKKLLLLGAVNAAVPFTLIAAAELRLTASLASLLNATTPLFAAVLAAAWFGERIGPRRATGLVIGVAGVGMLVGWSPVPLTTSTMLAILAMLVASACYGFSGLFVKRYLGGVSTQTLALGQQMGAAAWLLVPGIWLLPRAPVPNAALWALAGLSVLCTSLAYMLYFRLLATVGPVRTTTVTYLVPIFGMTWGALFLGETLTLGMILGLLTILASVLLVNDVRVPAVGRVWRATLRMEKRAIERRAAP